MLLYNVSHIVAETRTFIKKWVCRGLFCFSTRAVAFHKANAFWEPSTIDSGAYNFVMVQWFDLYIIIQLRFIFCYFYFYKKMKQIFAHIVSFSELYLVNSIVKYSSGKWSDSSEFLPCLSGTVKVKQFVQFENIKAFELI